MNDTGFRETQKETLNDLMEELQKKVRDIKAEIYPKNGKCERPRMEAEQFGRPRELWCSWKPWKSGLHEQPNSQADKENRIGLGGLEGN